ncbi:DMT family transporter [Nocardioides sp. MAHUQ-72]|uniref:DMT family transporter n=1 Tax=unclassified Nocardioides TaxID=2615069 RepID=UPI00360FB07D
MPNPRSLGAVAAVVTTLTWGGQFVVAASAFDQVDPVWQTAIRYGSAGLVLLVLLAAVEGRTAFARDAQLPRVAVLGTIGFAGFNLLAFVGLTMTTPQAASLIVSTMPLITAFVLWARTGVVPRPATWWTSAVALLGVALVLGDGHVGRVLHGGVGWGELLVLLGATSWVVYTTGAATVPGWSPLRYTALSASAGSVVIIAIAVALSAVGVLHAPAPVDVAAVGWQLAYITLAAGVVAVLCWNHAMRALGAQDGVLFINLVPVTTFALQALRGDSPHPGELLGVAVTLAALVASNLLARRAQPTSATSTSRTASSPRRTSSKEVESGESPILSPSGSR